MIKVLCSGDSEVWLPVVGFPKYEVSSLGRVRVTKTKAIKTPRTHRCRSYYPCIQLYVGKTDGKSEHYRYRQFYVHKLVADAFLPKIEGTTVHHKDFNKQNNCVHNLERVLHSENVYLSRVAGHYCKKLNPSKVKEIRNAYRDGQKIVNIARKYNIAESSVLDVVRNRTYKWVD